MRLGIEEGVVNRKTIKVLCKDAGGNVCKKELSIYTDQLPKETLVELLEESIQLD